MRPAHFHPHQANPGIPNLQAAIFPAALCARNYRKRNGVITRPSEIGAGIVKRTSPLATLPTPTKGAKNRRRLTKKNI